MSAEVVSTESAKMIVEGKDLATISEHVVVKLPTTTEGVKAGRSWSKPGFAST